MVFDPAPAITGLSVPFTTPGPLYKPVIPDGLPQVVFQRPLN